MIGLSKDLLVIDLGKHGIKPGDDFKLQDDEALIITAVISDTDYQAIQLGN